MPLLSCAVNQRYSLLGIISVATHHAGHGTAVLLEAVSLSTFSTRVWLTESCTNCIAAVATLMQYPCKRKSNNSNKTHGGVSQPEF